jgi:hypothetical protein
VSGAGPFGSSSVKPERIEKEKGTESTSFIKTETRVALF